MHQQNEGPYCKCLFYSANALSRVLTRMAEEAFAPGGVAPSHAFLLMSVNGQPGIQPNDLAKILMLTPSTITRLIEKLESKKLVKRRIDGRTTHVFSTPKGKQLDPALRKAWTTLYKQYAGILGADMSKTITDSIYQAAIDLDEK